MAKDTRKTSVKGNQTNGGSGNTPGNNDPQPYFKKSGKWQFILWFAIAVAATFGLYALKQ